MNGRQKPGGAGSPGGIRAVAQISDAFTNEAIEEVSCRLRLRHRLSHITCGQDRAGQPSQLSGIAMDGVVAAVDLQPPYRQIEHGKISAGDPKRLSFRPATA
ncbi:hypothetical protein KHC28_24015 [Ancylobacter sonchi]|uniref:hypothetical protein n=1 Tax=Ancylobacter sonchi TaxID=1937790 RepID=UPI001BD309F6|nr:hypothetical protein [Ancylobacter sonchi]MBS7536723.1 hypothetical protein [Ancylobacter sonchi]